MKYSRTNRKTRSQAGFSFIEILIVMGIIGVLVGGVIAAIGIWGRKGPEFTTKSLVRTVTALTQQWKQDFSFFPPGSVKQLPRTMGVGGMTVKGGNNPTNQGIEALVQAIKAKGFRAGHNFQSNEIANCDDDNLDAAISRDGDPALYEIMDAWGNPLIYFVNDDYAKIGDGGQMIMYGPESEHDPGGEITAMPWKDANGRYINSETFQIFSMGPDGEPNTDDDIGNWNTEDD